MHDLRRIRHAFLQQVCAAFGTALEEREGIRGIDVLREHHDADRRMRVTKCERRANALVGAGRRHANVGDDDVGLFAFGGFHEVVVRPARATDREIVLMLEQRDHAFSHQQVVLGHHHPKRHGRGQ